VAERQRGRPADPERRDRTLDRATDYVLAHGLEGLALRPLAQALGTSPRMLLYDFGSKAALVRAILERARERRSKLVMEEFAQHASPSAALEAFWRSLSAPDQRNWVRLLLQIRAEIQLGHLDADILGDWLAPYRALVEEIGSPQEDLSLISAVVLGLLEERQLAGDPERVEAAFQRFLGVIRTR